MSTILTLNPVTKLKKDVIQSSETLGDAEVRQLVDIYYKYQEDRIRNNAQVRGAEKVNEPSRVIHYLAEQSHVLEKEIQKVLTYYVKSKDVGRWLIHNVGIAGVLASGLLAHIDINKAPTVGHIWNYAGLNPSPDREWKKGQKRPHNAQLKTLCYKIGESFVKVSNHKDSFYGAEYKKRKQFEIDRNEQGYYKDHASNQLKKKNYGKTTDAYKCYSQGKLPPAHIHAIAKRWVVKLFLSHFHAIWYEHEFGQKAPVPYAIAHLGHAHLIEPPFTIEDIDRE